MPTSKNHRTGQIESHRRGRLEDKSLSFHVATSSGAVSGGQIRRPKTLPELLPERKLAVAVTDVVPREPPKVLVKVTAMGSLGPVQVVMRPESTVVDLTAAAVRQYVKEGRRPILPSRDPSQFDLHYSQFSLESLDGGQKLRELGSRSFFLCPRNCAATVNGGAGGDGSGTTPFASCSNEAEKASKDSGGGFGWLRFMEFLM